MKTCSHCERLQQDYPQLKLRECRQDASVLDLYTPLHVPKKGPVGARIFIHTRCVSGPASGALAAYLQEHGYDMDKVSIGPGDARGYHELVRLQAPDADGTLNLERMDGVRFTYRPPNPFPPSVA